MGLSREEAQVCVGPGWASLIDRFYGHVEDNPRIYKDVNVLQVKEKFGTLRIYFSGGDAFLDGIECTLGWWSGTICETCGALGQINTWRGWDKTQCKDHWDGPMRWERTLLGSGFSV